MVFIADKCWINKWFVKSSWTCLSAIRVWIRGVKMKTSTCADVMIKIEPLTWKGQWNKRISAVFVGSSRSTALRCSASAFSFSTQHCIARPLHFVPSEGKRRARPASPCTRPFSTKPGFLYAEENLQAHLSSSTRAWSVLERTPTNWSLVHFSVGSSESRLLSLVRSLHCSF